MPLVPARVSRPAQTGVEAILARGTSAFRDVLQSAIQTGRDVANNQARAERDFLTEQRREIDLRQRRSENARAAFEADRGFDEGVRRFDVTQDFRDRSLDEQVRANDLDRVLARVRINNDVAGLIEDSQDRRRDDARADRALTLQEQREQRALKAEDREVGLDNLRLQELQFRVQNAKTEAEREAAQAAQNEALQQARGQTLTQLNEAIQAGDLDTGRSIFNERVNDPAFGFDSSTKRTFARQLGLEDSSTSGADEASIQDLSLEEANSRLEVLKKTVASGANPNPGEGSEKLRREAAALRQHIAELESQTPEGRKSILDTLSRSGQNAQAGR